MLTKFKQIFKSAYDFEKAFKVAELKQQDMDCLKKHLASLKNVPKSLLDHQLLPYLKLTRNDPEKAAKLIENYYKIKKDSPEFCKNRDVLAADVQTSLDNQNYVILPSTPDKCNLMLFGFSSYDPRDFNFDHAAKTFIISYETAVFKNGPQNGIKFLVDLKGTGVGLLLRPSLSSLRKVMRILQEGLPLPLDSIHVLNTFSFVNMLLVMVKPFDTTGFLSKIHWHHSNMDYKKFYNEHIPKSCLPSDYGGDLESVAELHDKHRTLLIHMKEYFNLEEEQTNLKF